jgi:Insertion element 4 transposase N-terminal/Transposase DDE domain
MSVLDRDLERGGLRWSACERVQALKRIVTKRSISIALGRAGRGKRHCRRVSRPFMVWFVIAMGLFCRDSYQQVFRWLVPFKVSTAPGRSTLCEARQSIGPGPLRRLAHSVVELLAKADTPRAFYAGMRLMAIDGFVLNVADSPANSAAFGRPGNDRAPGAFPQVRVLSLCEVGTHVLWRSLVKPQHRGEVTMARYLLGFLLPSMLLLWDRNFLSYQLVSDVVQRGAQLLGRAKTGVIFQPIRHFKDGSYLAKVYPSPRDREKDRDGILVRIIEYVLDDPGRPGLNQKHRLLTTLLDPRRHPAKGLIVLYHERWEEELTIDELKTHLRERPVLRSETPAGVIQEVYGLILGHFVVRKLMCDAAELADCAPRDLSFVNSLKILRCRLGEAPRTLAGINAWHSVLLEEVSQQRLEPRRNRVNPRVIKCKMSHWDKKRPKHRNYPQPTKDFRKSIVMVN